MDSLAGLLASLLLNAALAVVAVLYFVPTIVALKRNANPGPVIVVNVFLGWMLLGWVAALALPVSGSRASTPFEVRSAGATVGMDEQQALVNSVDMTIHHGS